VLATSLTSAFTTSTSITVVNATVPGSVRYDPLCLPYQSITITTIQLGDRCRPDLRPLQESATPGAINALALQHKQRRTRCKIREEGSYCKHGQLCYQCSGCLCVRGTEDLIQPQDEPQCPICLDLVTVRLCEEGTSATRSTRSIPIDTTCPLKAQCCGTTYHLSCLQANQQHSSVSEAPCPICRSTRLGRQVRLATRENLF